MASLLVLGCGGNSGAAKVDATTPDMVYERHDPFAQALHRVVREYLATFYVAIEEGWQTGLPEFVRAEFAGFLDCSVMQRGFAHLACEDCGLPRLVVFTSAGRGFCPTCLGRRMNQTGEMRQSILGCLKKITSLVPKAGCCGPNR